MFSLKVESELKWDTISNLGPFTACPLSPSLIGQTTQQHKDQAGDDEDSEDAEIKHGVDEDGDRGKTSIQKKRFLSGIAWIT